MPLEIWYSITEGGIKGQVTQIILNFTLNIAKTMIAV